MPGPFLGINCVQGRLKTDSFLGFCITQLEYTVYTQPSKRKPNSRHFKKRGGASLVVQWLRIHLPMQGTGV